MNQHDDPATLQINRYNFDNRTGSACTSRTDSIGKKDIRFILI